MTTKCHIYLSILQNTHNKLSHYRRGRLVHRTWMLRARSKAVSKTFSSSFGRSVETFQNKPIHEISIKVTICFFLTFNLLYFVWNSETSQNWFRSDVNSSCLYDIVKWYVWPNYRLHNGQFWSIARPWRSQGTKHLPGISNARMVQSPGDRSTKHLHKTDLQILRNVEYN